MVGVVRLNMETDCIKNPEEEREQERQHRAEEKEHWPPQKRGAMPEEQEAEDGDGDWWTNGDVDDEGWVTGVTISLFDDGGPETLYYRRKRKKQGP